jgi:hypothetical protein
VGRWLGFVACAVGGFLVVGIAWFALQWLVLGETECNRGTCGPMGEFSESVGLAGLLVVWAAVALAVAWALVRPGRRTPPE